MDYEHPSFKPFKCPVCASHYFGPVWSGKEHVGRYCKGWPSGYDRSYIACPGSHEEIFGGVSNHTHRAENYNVRAGGTWVLGAMLLLWLYDRLSCGISGPKPLPKRELIDAVQKIDPGYCLDAPSVMPAGGMGNAKIQGLDDVFLQQLLCEREGATP